jgi:hypothetical protein
MFEKESNARTGVNPSDLVVVLEHMLHPRFGARRDNLDMCTGRTLDAARRSLDAHCRSS